MDVFAFAALEVDDDVTVLLGSARQQYRTHVVATFRSAADVQPGSVRVDVFGGLVVARERVLAGDRTGARESNVAGPAGSSSVASGAAGGRR